MLHRWNSLPRALKAGWLGCPREVYPVITWGDCWGDYGTVRCGQCSRRASLSVNIRNIGLWMCSPASWFLLAVSSFLVRTCRTAALIGSWERGLRYDEMRDICERCALRMLEKPRAALTSHVDAL